jgi:hypothetical protein
MYNYWKIYTFILLSYVICSFAVNALAALAVQGVASWETAQGTAWAVIMAHIGLGLATVYSHLTAKKSDSPPSAT